MQFTDIHTHWIPAIDDGPRAIGDTLEQLRFAHAGGTRTMVATPHMFHDSFDNFDMNAVQDQFARTVAELRQWSQRSGWEFLAEMELLLGAENFASLAFLEALEAGRVLSLAGSRYLLVEYALNLPSQHILSVVDRVVGQGLVPVLAHVERYAAVRKDPGLLAACLEKGCLTQVNADALDGPFWSRGRRLVWGLLEKNLVSIIASDSHGADYRPPQLLETYYKVSSRLGPESAEALLCGNPQWIVSAGSSPG